ncbi:G5 domain-containing protein [Couchioplanes caeruleus]|uniref:G5 domain-containing protein n=1 Tax=Couchioplanes caeruleus TaxID=56438 RepID=UPI0020BDB2AA|nr:G5 domain-containing protein [Couchioplanes caeruleus]UQU65670.1 G5 domain-containing protein [Couchioplanes caeruleus]
MPRKSFWARLPFGVRMTAAGLGVLTLVAGTAGGVVALTGDERADAVRAVGQEAVAVAPLDAAAPTEAPPSPSPSPVASSAPVLGHAAAEEEEIPSITEDRSAPGEADRTATRAPRRTSTVAGTVREPARVAATGAVPVPLVGTERVSETQTIPFRTMLVRDPSLPRGSKRVQTRGVPGERVLHYEVTYTGNKETARRLLDSTVTREPQHRVIAFGNRRSGGGDTRPDGPCGGDKSECAPLARSAVCSDETKPEEEELLDQHLGLLSSDDLDALDLTMPCEDDE